MWSKTIDNIDSPLLDYIVCLIIIQNDLLKYVLSTNIIKQPSCLLNTHTPKEIPLMPDCKMLLMLGRHQIVSPNKGNGVAALLKTAITPPFYLFQLDGCASHKYLFLSVFSNLYFRVGMHECICLSWVTEIFF